MAKSNGKTSLPSGKKENFLVGLLLKIVPDWVTPNVVSALRLVMIPLIIASMALGSFRIALALFLFAALLDTVDGTLARARKQITELGMLLDPLADKLLIMSILAFFLILYPYKLLIIYVFVFDFLILLMSALRVSQIKSGKITAIRPSNFWGKSKMVTQVAGISLAFLWIILPVAPLLYVSFIVIWLSLVFQIGSAITYSA
jgi:CDP-diacylglycerol--glycerol-3-phosphate 3-phosphatidyltransferase